MASFGGDRPLEISVSGKPFVIARKIVSKYPFSRLADLIYETPRGTCHMLELDVNAFAAVLYYLEYGNLNEVLGTSSYILQQTFDALNIPAPCLDNATYKHTSPKPTMNGKTTSADLAPPAYEEISHQITDSGTKNGSNADAKELFGPALPTQLAIVREQRITSLIHTYILPFVAEQGFAGLYRTSCVLVPSNVSALESSSSAADVIVGFPDEDNVRMIRLDGELNTIEFWRQDVVIAELETKLKDALFSQGHKVASGQVGLPVINPSSESEQPLPSRPPSKRSWFRRRLESKEVSDDDDAPTNSSGGWRAQEAAPQLEPREITIKVTLEDICLRIITDLGLYDNRTGKAIVVRIHAAHQES